MTIEYSIVIITKLINGNILLSILDRYIIYIYNSPLLAIRKKTSDAYLARSEANDHMSPQA